MEDPQSWDLLTASLAVSDLSNAFEVWSFLVAQGLVRDEPADREAFCRIVQEELDVGEHTGPSVAARVADRLNRTGMVHPIGHMPDPWGETAKARRHQVRRGN